MSDIMKNGVFDWEVFKDRDNKIAVHLKTQEECDEFSKMLDEHGMKWNTNGSYLKENYWYEYKKYTCYSNKGTYCDLDYYKEENCYILEFSDYFNIKKEIKENNKKGENKMNSITVNMENLTVKEREQLLALVKKSNEPKVWKPKKNEEYYFINTNDCISRDMWDKYNVYGNGRYSIGNCFKTKEEAEFAREKLKVIAELKRFAQEHNEYEIDLKNFSQYKYYIYIDLEDKKFFISYNYRTLIGNNIYFTSEEIAKKAIDAIGADRLKKYYFEVED